MTKGQEYKITLDDLEFLFQVLITLSHIDILISHTSVGFITGIQVNGGINWHDINPCNLFVTYLE